MFLGAGEGPAAPRVEAAALVPRAEPGHVPLGMSTADRADRGALGAAHAAVVQTGGGEKREGDERQTIVCFRVSRFGLRTPLSNARPSFFNSERRG